jgi:hypothetical protein
MINHQLFNAVALSFISHALLAHRHSQRGTALSKALCAAVEGSVATLGSCALECLKEAGFGNVKSSTWFLRIARSSAFVPIGVLFPSRMQRVRC